MPQLAFAKRFFQNGDYDALPVYVRKNVREAMDKVAKLSHAQLKADKGLNFKPPVRARNRNVRTFKVDNFHRGGVYVQEGGEILLLLKVLPHDDAYDWAAKLDAGANPATRGLEIWDAEGLEHLTPAMEQQAAAVEERQFDAFSDGDLRTLGIDDTTLRAARSIVKDELEVFVPYLPEDQVEVLQYLAHGFTVEEVWRDILAQRIDDQETYLAGDPHQRIYDAKVSLKSMGINVVGRTTRLKKNYRSTQEILAWSRALLDGRPVEGLADAGADTLAGFRSTLRGDTPTAFGAAERAEEIAGVAQRVREWVDAGIAPAEIAVAGRFNNVATKVRDALEEAGVQVVLLRSDPDPDTDGVRVGTMHALKGLEFRCVAVAGVCDWALPFARAVTPEDVDPVQHATDMMAERCLLFVACTRARDRLHVSWHGEPSAFLVEAGVA